MGLCPLQPELRVINNSNTHLRDIIMRLLKQSNQYAFVPLIQQLLPIQPKFLYNEIILDDIQALHHQSKAAKMHIKGQSQIINGSAEYPPLINKQYQNGQQYLSGQQVQCDLKESCMMMQVDTQDLLTKQVQPQSQSFVNNVKANQSIVMQINIIYSAQTRIQEYSSALRLLLKWAHLFQQHASMGFLRPIYRQFFRHVSALPKDDFPTVVDQVCGFVNCMVAVLSQVYGMDKLSKSQQGRLFKTDNVFNIVMTFLFKSSKIKRYLSEAIRLKEGQKIEQFRHRIRKYKHQPMKFYGVSLKFILGAQSKEQTSQTNRESPSSYQISQEKQQNQHRGQDQIRQVPYESTLQKMSQLGNSDSPLTKLKTIVSISKQIMRDIRQHYDKLGRQAPQMDPDNLSSIVMYLLVEGGNGQVWCQLKMVEHFTTTNCLNCISGYYLNVFLAAAQSILELPQ